MDCKTLTVPFVADPDWVRQYGDPSHKIACDNGWAGLRAGVDASFVISYNNDAVQIIFTTKGAPLICNHFANQEAVCQDSCVEFFVQPPGDGRYINFEFNILGYVNASRRYGRADAEHLTADEIASIKRETVYRADEPFEFYDLEDDTWILTVTIPWRLIGVVPEPGMVLKANFQVCSDAARPPYYLSWSPIATEKPDFHRPEFFGEIILGDPS